MGDVIQENRYYLKKGRGLWFGLALALIIINLIWQYVSSILFSQLVSSSGTGPAIAVSILASLVICGGWAVVLLGYGLNNTVKAHKVLFIILACFQLPGLLMSIVSHLGMIELFAGKANSAIFTYGLNGLLSFLLIATWVACLLVMAFGRKASAPLRVSSALLAFNYFLTAVYSIAQMYLIRALSATYGTDILVTYYIVTGLAISAFYLGTNVFFYAVMAFSKWKNMAIPTRSAEPLPENKSDI